MDSEKEKSNWQQRTDNCTIIGFGKVLKGVDKKSRRRVESMMFPLATKVKWLGIPCLLWPIAYYREPCYS